MVLTPLSKHNDKVASLLNCKPEIVQSVSDQLFRYLKNYFISPTKSGIRYPHFGVMRPSKRLILIYLHRLIVKLRDNPTEELKKEFRIYWALRHVVQSDVDQRNFKKRYGSYHWKKKEVITNE